MAELPIDSVLPELVKALSSHSAVVLEAPPGAGKTTRAPGALLDAELAGDKKILVVEPRRMAVRLSANFVAQERGGSVGGAVGYRIRHESKVSSQTQLVFQTEGLVLRQLASDPTLQEFGVVILDEFHERNIASDLVLAILSELQKTSRPDLKLVVMSATLNAEFIESYFDDCIRIRSEGRAFPVEVVHLAHRSERRLEKEVRTALVTALNRDQGDILIFLPGMGEIRRCLQECDELIQKANALGLPLHGSLSLKDQERAVAKATKRKIIFSTNVAETSVTIDGVTTVIDSGLARVASIGGGGLYTSLGLEPISQASGIQRAGRAGRTQAGVCYRLFTKSHFGQRPAYDIPEMVRSDLSDAILLLASMGFSDLESFPFLTRPKDDSINATRVLLQRLGAIDVQNEITDLGRQFLQYPLHPRFSKLVVESAQNGIADLGVLSAAILSERDFRFREEPFPTGNSDILALCDLYRQVEESKFAKHRIRNLGLNERTLKTIQKTKSQLERVLKTQVQQKVSEPDNPENQFLRILMKSFPDRVAKRVSAGGQRKGEREVLLISGGRASVSSESGIGDAEYVIAVDMGERRQQGRAKLLVRLASVIEVEWIMDEWIEWIQERTHLSFHPKRERVEAREALELGAISLDETISVALPSDESAEILSKAAWSVRHKLGMGEECDALLARLQLVQKSVPESTLELGELQAPEDVVRLACRGRISFAELKGLSIEEALMSSFDYSQQELLKKGAPTHFKLRGGKRLRIHYEAGKSPWIEGYIQDFYGMNESPMVAQGRVPLTIHFLAPNKRPIQVTTDLSGFWERHYPELSKALSRRYPRHHWPEDPSKARALLLKRHL